MIFNAQFTYWLQEPNREGKKVVTDILGIIEFSIDFKNTGKNTRFKIKIKSGLKVIL